MGSRLGLWAGDEGLQGDAEPRVGIVVLGVQGWTGRLGQGHGWGAQGGALQLRSCLGVQGLSPCCAAPTQPHSSAPILGGAETSHGAWKVLLGVSTPPPRLQVLQILAGKVVVGHAIHNDFKALRYSHPKALTRDTSQIPLLNHLGGFPENVSISLKRLTKALLNQDIQVPWLEPPQHARGGKGSLWGRIQGTLSSGREQGSPVPQFPFPWKAACGRGELSAQPLKPWGLSHALFHLISVHAPHASPRFSLYS